MTRRITLPLIGSKSNSNLTDLIDSFLLALEAKGDSPRTVGSYKQRLKSFLCFCKTHGLVTIKDVRPQDLNAWVVSLRRQKERWADHIGRRPRQGSLSEATISGRIQSVKAFFTWCMERGYVDHSPSNHLKKLRLDHWAGEKVMALDDLLKMLAVAEEQAQDGYPRNLALLCFLAETGCRVGEAASLRISALNLDACESWVTGKTDRRLADFTDRTVKAIRNWLAVRPDVDHDYVFVARHGGPLTTRAIYNIFRRLAEKAGVQGQFNPHAIRHLVGQTWTDKTNLELARQKLGHKDISTTALFYSHQGRTRVKEATKRLSLVISM